MAAVNNGGKSKPSVKQWIQICIRKDEIYLGETNCREDSTFHQKGRSHTVHHGWKR